MRISYNWLKELVDFPQSPEELCELLTFIGIETRVVEKSGGWKSVVTAKVKTVAKHPNADKLHLCTVTDGSRDYQIVCGAPNVAEGQVVPLALIGAELPGNFTIKRAKIRGVESEGMICSEKELGLAEESSGIMVLPETTQLGRPLQEMLGDSDAILEVEITTNRADCLSHWGVAREIAAKLNKPVKLPAIGTTADTGTVRINIENGTLCPRYIGTLMTGVKIGPSPSWMARRLEKCGLRPINNIVDITNYVLIELGHPLHAFDKDTLAGGEIDVRTARPGEKIRALDGKDYALKDSIIVIADAARPRAIAGVMGGEDSGVTEKTTSIILESALFDAPSIRRTSRELGLSTDASYRFERGTGWQTATMAANRAMDLIREIAGGKIEGRTDKVMQAYEPVEIMLRPERVKYILNIDFADQDIGTMLTALGIDVRREDGKFRCVIPSWRLDLRQEIDLIEELARLKGYDAIPVTVLTPEQKMEEGKEMRPAEDIMRERLHGLGFCETMNYSFAESESLKKFGQTSSYRLANPLSKENEVLRPSLLSGLWKNLTVNLGQGYDEIRLYETGTVFTEHGEHNALGVLVSGSVWSDWWGWEQRKTTVPKYDFYFLGGVIEHVFAGNKVSVCENKTPAPYFHPGKTAVVRVNGKIVGQYGMLRPEYAAETGAEIGYAEFDLSLIEEIWNRKTPRYAALRRFPPAKRDISLLAKKDVTFDRVIAVLDDFCGRDALMQEYKLFSRYEDPAKLGPDYVSYSLHLLFRHPEHTLTDADVNGQIEQILSRLNKELGVTLRA
jgi:phenylalanyl-tRNA synthetase beta chain